MRISRFLTAAVVICSAGSSARAADQVRYYEQNGVTYCETRRVEQMPVVETRTQQSTQTVYREETVTELRDTARQRWTPVTEYRWEATWVGRWNPFVQPYLAYRYVPRTRWECATETVRTPVVSRRLVPETRTVLVPVTTQRMVDREVITRVAVSRPAVAGGTTVAGAAWTPPTVTAQVLPIARDRGPVGGIARLESDPPRQGVSTAWRHSGGTQR